MAINTVIGLFTLIAILTVSELDYVSKSFIFLPVLVVFLAIGYIGIRIYKNSLRALQVAPWLYVIQIVSVDTENLSFYFNTGIQFTISWEVGTSSVAVNLAAVAICIFLFSALSSVKKQANKTTVESNT